jgi:hypothetical protein
MTFGIEGVGVDGSPKALPKSHNGLGNCYFVTRKAVGTQRDFIFARADP